MMLIVHTLLMASMHIRFKFGTADLWWWSKCEECNLKYYCVFLPYRLFFAPGPWLWVLTSPGSRLQAHTVDLCLGKRRKKKNELFSLPLAVLCVLPALWSGAKVKGKGLSEGADSSLSCLSVLDFFAAVAAAASSTVPLICIWPFSSSPHLSPQKTLVRL